MSLFDDLLTKVQSSSSTSSSTGSSGSGSSTGGSGQQDPMAKTNGPIIISESTPIATSQEIRMAPVEPEVAIIQPIEPPTITITEAPMLATLPIQEVQSPIEDVSPIQVEVPVEESIPLFEMTDSPVETVQESAPDSFILTDKNTAKFMEDGFTENETSENIVNNDTMSNSPLFDMSNDFSSSSSNDFSSSSVDPVESNSTEESPKVEENIYRISSNDASFRNTKEYLKHAYEEVEVLIATIDQENEDKIKEREGYRAQKEHFAELELQADGEHQKMLEERAHAKRMKTYLEHEQAKSELPPISKKTVVAKKITPITHAKKKVIKPRTRAANHANFAQLA